MVFKLGSSELKASTLTTWPQPWHRKREFLWHIFGRNLFRERFLLHFLAFSDVRQNQWSNERRSKSKYLRQKWNKIGNRSGRRNKIKKTFSEKLKSSEWIYAASKYSFAHSLGNDCWVELLLYYSLSSSIGKSWPIRRSTKSTEYDFRNNQSLVGWGNYIVRTKHWIYFVTNVSKPRQ